MERAIGLLSRRSCYGQKAWFFPSARHLRRRGTSMCPGRHSKVTAHSLGSARRDRQPVWNERSDSCHDARATGKERGCCPPLATFGGGARPCARAALERDSFVLRGPPTRMKTSWLVHPLKLSSHRSSPHRSLRAR